MQIAIGLFPGFTALDAIGPYQVFTNMPGIDVVTDMRRHRWPGPRRAAETRRRRRTLTDHRTPKIVTAKEWHRPAMSCSRPRRKPPAPSTCPPHATPPDGQVRQRERVRHAGRHQQAWVDRKLAAAFNHDDPAEGERACRYLAVQLDALARCSGEPARRSRGRDHSSEAQCRRPARREPHEHELHREHDLDRVRYDQEREVVARRQDDQAQVRRNDAQREMQLTAAPRWHRFGSGRS